MSEVPIRRDWADPPPRDPPPFWRDYVELAVCLAAYGGLLGLVALALWWLA